MIQGTNNNNNNNNNNNIIIIIITLKYSAHLILHQTSKAIYGHSMVLYKVYLTESFIEEMDLKLLLDVFDVCCSPDAAWKVIPMGGSHI